MDEIKLIAKIENFLAFNHDRSAVKAIIDELCSKGVANGCFQDYGSLIAVLDILSSLAECVGEA